MKLKKNNWSAENNFYWTCHQSRIEKFIAQYKIFEKSSKIKGDIVEFGVFKGISLIRFLSFRNMFKQNSKKKVFGFDTFKKFPLGKLNNIDLKFVKSFTKYAGNPIRKSSLVKILKKKNFSNFELIEGNIFDKLDMFLKRIKKISLLHIDVDTFPATSYILKKTYSKVSRGGCIIFDDFNSVEGATQAINIFKKKKKLKLKKVSFSNKVIYFLIKK